MDECILQENLQYGLIVRDTSVTFFNPSYSTAKREPIAVRAF